MREKNLKTIEGLLFVLFVLLWGLFLSGGSGKVKRRTLSLWESVPIQKYSENFFENGIQKGNMGWHRFLDMIHREEKRLLLPFFEWNADRAFRFNSLLLITGKEKDTIRQNIVITYQAILQNRTISLEEEKERSR